VSTTEAEEGGIIVGCTGGGLAEREVLLLRDSRCSYFHGYGLIQGHQAAVKRYAWKYGPRTGYSSWLVSLLDGWMGSRRSEGVSDVADWERRWKWWWLCHGRGLLQKVRGLHAEETPQPRRIVHRQLSADNPINAASHPALIWTNLDRAGSTGPCQPRPLFRAETAPRPLASQFKGFFPVPELVWANDIALRGGHGGEAQGAWRPGYF
jgi:hypothetical protein